MESIAVKEAVRLAKGLMDPCIVLDYEGRIVDFNRPFVSLHEIPKKQMKSLKGALRDELLSLKFPNELNLLEHCKDLKIGLRYDEVQGETPSGKKLNLIVNAIPILSDKNDFLGMVEIHRDATDEASIHAKYKVFLDKEKRAKEELERLVNERTAELRKANEELKKAESQLVHSEKMSSLGQMVAGIAHELNNPINFIYGNTDTLSEYVEDLRKFFSMIAVDSEKGISKDTLKKSFEACDIDFIIEDLPKIVGSIRTGSERSADIIQGLRTFSRLDEARMKATNLHHDIDTCLTLLKNKYKDRITIHKNYLDIPQVICSSGQMNQVFMNLLHNAIQAIPKEGDIWIETRHLGENVEIEIRDSGEGIPEDVRAKIFDPFFTTKDVGEGTGLGLSISYGIVEKHEGQILCESEVGKGTKFIVRLPVQGPKVPD